MGVGYWFRIAVGCLTVCHLPALRAQDVTSILDKTASVLQDAEGIAVTFTLQTRSEQQRISENFEGTIDIKGDKFVLKTPDMVTWFDGTTQWSYVEQTGEVNVSEPTGEELQAVNPVFLLRSYRKGFKARYGGECTAANGKAAYLIGLSPEKRSDITEVELQVEKYSSFPASIVIRMQDGISSTVHIDRIRTGIGRPDDFFIFPEADYPDAEVIDLR